MAVLHLTLNKHETVVSLPQSLSPQQLNLREIIITKIDEFTGAVATGTYNASGATYSKNPAGALFIDFPFLHSFHVLNNKHNAEIPIPFSHDQFQHYEFDVKMKSETIPQSFIVKTRDIDGGKALFEADRGSGAQGGRIKQIDLIFQYQTPDKFF